MNKEPIKLLLIEDNQADCKLIKIKLNTNKTNKFKITCTERLASGLKLLESKKFDIILLDLGLPDSKGLESFKTALTKHPTIPIIVLTGLANEEIGIQAIRYGAQDYLVKGEFKGNLLARAIQYAIERKKQEGLFIY
jgi:DNA-binding response OmpR family regulator